MQCFEAATVPSDPFLKKSSEYLKIILDTVTQERYSVLAVEEEPPMTAKDYIIEALFLAGFIAIPVVIFYTAYTATLMR